MISKLYNDTLIQGQITSFSAYIRHSCNNRKMKYKQ